MRTQDDWIKLQEVSVQLENNNMHTVVLHHKEDVLPYLQQHINSEQSISLGGSMTLQECGITEYVQKLPHFINRSKNPKDAFFADIFLCSANAITLRGEIYDVDGIGHRVAPLIYGPKHVFIVAGKNKIVSSLQDAIIRVKTIAAPKNSQRLAVPSYCHEYGKCADMTSLSVAACNRTMCSFFVVLGKQEILERISIVLVNDELGF